MGKIIERDKNFMNTIISIIVVQNDEKTIDILNAIELGFNEFDRIVKQYTRFNEDSELSNLNRRAGEWTKVNEEFFRLVKFMVEIAETSNGAFDPTIIDFLEVYGYDKNYDFTKLENPQLSKFVEDIARSRKSFRDIKFNDEKKSIKLENGQRIDLGGIGKGYAIDCAFNQMRGAGLENFLISAGGDIRAIGRNQDDKIWSVSLKDENSIVGYLDLDNSAVASSGSWARKVKQFHHIIDPKTGKPVEKRRTVFVTAENALLADTWATTIFVGGEDVAKKAPTDMKYFIV